MPRTNGVYREGNFDSKPEQTELAKFFQEDPSIGEGQYYYSDFKRMMLSVSIKVESVLVTRKRIRIAALPVSQNRADEVTRFPLRSALHDLANKASTAKCRRQRKKSGTHVSRL